MNVVPLVRILGLILLLLDWGARLRRHCLDVFFQFSEVPVNPASLLNLLLLLVHSSFAFEHVYVGLQGRVGNCSWGAIVDEDLYALVLVEVDVVNLTFSFLLGFDEDVVTWVLSS